MNYKLAHISDPHFYHLCTSLYQFFNRQAFANFNYLFTRYQHFDQKEVYALIDHLKQQQITSLLISGDVTCMSSKEEFTLVEKFLQTLHKQGITPYAIPGNHDVYTKRAANEKWFFKRLAPYVDFQGSYSFHLEKDGIAAYSLPCNVHLLLLDATCFNRGTKANGLFTTQHEKTLTALLGQIPSHERIILSAHFPYMPYKAPKAHMLGGDRLAQLLNRDPRILCYLHGHRHRPQIIDSSYHTIVDAGSISQRNNHSYSLLEWDENDLIITLYTQRGKHHEQKQLNRTMV